MLNIDKEWLENFRFHMTRLFGINAVEEIFDNELIVRYLDTPPEMAARKIGEDYDFTLVDVWTSDEMLRRYYCKTSGR